MPAESASTPAQTDQGQSPPPAAGIKCAVCGAGAIPGPSWAPPAPPVTDTDLGADHQHHSYDHDHDHVDSTQPLGQLTHPTHLQPQRHRDPLTDTATTPSSRVTAGPDVHSTRVAVVAAVATGARVCRACVRLAAIDTDRTRAMEEERKQERDREGRDITERESRDSMGLGLLGIGRNDSLESSHPSHRSASDADDTIYSLDHSTQHAIPIPSQASSPTELSSTLPSGSRTHAHAQSLPTQSALPWSTARLAHRAHLAAGVARDSSASPVASSSSSSGSARVAADRDEEERAPNRLLDVTRARIPSVGRGCLFPGSVFKGTQTSGRSAYDVEVRIIDVSFPDSTLCGYLSISHLTDSHPHLTTFFTGEIIGPKYGFITGSRFGATEHDDMRHWGRFEQFRRASTRADFVRPDLLLRDPVPDASRGETWVRERDFVFLRIKERFLVPDHTVRDISGASFAGFYYAMVDLSPSTSRTDEPGSPITPHSPNIPTSPVLPRRSSSSTATATRGTSSSRPDIGKTRRESATRLREQQRTREATIRGYYFHSLNQEPFQELFLSHEPSRSSSSFEMR